MISISQYLLAVSAGRALLLHELDASQFVRHARRASFKDPRPERTSRVDRPVPSGYFVASAPPHKSFSCNTYGSPPKYYRQKTYGVAKLFRCHTYKKQGGGSRLWLTRIS